MSQKYMIAGFSLLALFCLSVYAMQALFTSQTPGANDFYPRWIGAQLFWGEGIDPYSDTATEVIQRGIYGRPAMADEDQVLFVYPFYTIFLLLPLIWLPLSYAWIQAIWLVVLQFALIAAVLLCLSVVKWRMPLWLLACTLLWAVVFYNSARTIILGQFAALIFLWLVGAVWALQRGWDGAGGLMLALTTIKPQMSFLIIPALLLWAIGQRRWRFLGSFVVTMGVLAGLSFVLLPGWLAGFVSQVAYYPDYTITGPPLWVITGYYWPQLGKPVEMGLSLLLLLYLFYQWRHLLGVTADSDAFLAIVGLTLVVTNMIVVRTATTNYVVLYLPLFWGLKQLAQRMPQGNLWIALFYLSSTIGMWALFLATISGDLEHPIMYLPLPFTLLLWLVWGAKNRRQEKAVIA